MSRTQYIIQGNEVLVQPIGDEVRLALSDLLPALTSYQPLELFPVPDGLRYILVKPVDGMGLEVQAIMQFNPSVRRINYKNALIYANEDTHSFSIAMPFCLFWVHMTAQNVAGTRGESRVWSPKKWGLMWSRTPMADVNTPVTYAWMPNCYRDTRVCFGTNTINARQPFGDYVNELINLFWTSGFNTDLTYPWPYPTMDDWQNASRENPAVWTQWRTVWNSERPIHEWLRDITAIDWNQPVPDSVEGAPIPALRTVPTFANLTGWLDTLTEDQRTRLAAVIEARRG